MRPDNRKIDYLTTGQVPGTSDLFRILLETVPSVIYITEKNHDFTCRYVSDNFRELTGYEPADAIGSSTFWFNHIHPDDSEKVFREFPSDWSDASGCVEYRIRTRNGTYRWIQDRFRTSNQSISGNIEIVGAWTDITELRKTEQKFRGLLEATPDAMVTINQDGKIVFVNSQTESLFGYTREELIDQKIEMLIPERFRDKHPDHRNGYFEKPQIRPMGKGLKLLARGKNGTEFPVEISLSPIETEEGLLVTSAIRDISEHVENEKDLKQLNERLRLLLNSSSEGIFGIDMNGLCTFINKGGARMLGYRVEELSGKDMYELTHAGEEGGVYSRNDSPMIAVCLDGQARRAYDEVFQLKNGRDMPVQYSAFPITDGENVTGAIVTFSDITEKKLADRRLNYVVNYDALTDLPNRNYFHDRLNAAIARSQDNGNKVAILYMDLDGFKDINDTLGHNAGDHLLRELANRMRNELRDNRLFARTDGDMFACLAEDINGPDQAAELAQQLLVLLRKPFVIKSQELFVRACIGISLFPDDGRDTATILRNADTALFKSKEQGTNVFQFYKSDMNADKANLLELDAELRYALERNEFELFYQPQADISTGRITGFEALIRWNHKEKGLVSPIHFIPLLEETGLIIEVGEWTIREACQQLRKWQNAFNHHLSVSVNMSGQQFKMADVINPVLHITEKFNISPGQLELEITESILMEHFQTVIESINALTARGTRFSIDDFGTGYSSLAYLKSLPVQKLKIDRAFVREMHENKGDQEICAAIVALGQNLGLTVIAEGVENEEQLQKLKDMGCHQIQGYFLSKPLPAGEANIFLERHIGGAHKISTNPIN